MRTPYHHGYATDKSHIIILKPGNIKCPHILANTSNKSSVKNAQHLYGFNAIEMAGRHPRYRGHCVPTGHSTVLIIQLACFYLTNNSCSDASIRVASSAGGGSLRNSDEVQAQGDRAASGCQEVHGARRGSLREEDRSERGQDAETAATR